ncbi:MAG: hypothetical protein HY258_06135 [Chloroflexi bacterium]|nr:hypothetical protein [Chloroflexota bacterium]
MKLLKFGLRFWIALTSVFSFMVGWVMIAHSPKPVQSSSASSSISALPTLTPLQPLNFNSNSNNSQSSPFIVQSPSNIAQAPIFKTGGS